MFSSLNGEVPVCISLVHLFTFHSLFLPLPFFPFMPYYTCLAFLLSPPLSQNLDSSLFGDKEQSFPLVLLHKVP